MDEVREVDVDELMAGLEGDAAKAKPGMASPGAPAAPSRGGLDRDLASLHASYNIWDVRFHSHRWLLGPLVVLLKRVLRRLLTPVLTRQMTYNAANARVAISQERRLTGAEEALAAHAGSLQEISAEVERLRTQVRELRLNDVQVLRQQVSRAERTVRRTLHALGNGYAEAAGPVERGPGHPDAPEPEFDYLGFAERFRGSEAEIKERQRVYVPYFRGQRDVLDLGCGRGEFLELLAEQGIGAKGVDTDLDMILLCREKGLEVVRADVMAYLGNLPDDSLGGAFCAQLVEHLPPAEIIKLVNLCHRKLFPGAALVVETPNPRCLMTFAEGFYMDFSHVRPVHPEAMRFLFESSGFRDIEVKFSSAVEAALRVPPLPESGVLGPGLEAFNRGIERLNETLFGFQDYAVIGRKGRVRG